MVRAIVRGVIHSRDYPEDAIETMVTTGAWNVMFQWLPTIWLKKRSIRFD